jgi:SAM-dependent methyltransferase
VFSKNWTDWICTTANRLVPNARRVLEIGGRGQELSDFTQGREFHALNSPVEDICRPTPFPDGHFDLIVSKMSFEHFYEPFAAADEITRLLAPGGALLVMTVWSWRYHTAPGVEDYFRFSVPALRQVFPRLREVESGYDLADRRADCRLDNVAVDELGGWREHWYVYLAACKPRLTSTPAPLARYRANLSLLSYSFDDIRSAYETLLGHDSVAEAVNTVLSMNESNVDPLLLDDGERGLPSEERFFSTGYYRMMLGRYLFAAAQVCRGAEVLDTCSGLGWGTFLVAQYAARVTAFDLDDQAVSFCRKAWPQANIDWLSGNALTFDFLPVGFFDVALAMETVEHFSAADARVYIANIEGRLRAGGVLIGTSAFPATREEADAIAATNPHHPHVFTNGEFLELLHTYFSRAAVIGGWMFIAIK